MRGPLALLALLLVSTPSFGQDKPKTPCYPAATLMAELAKAGYKPFATADEGNNIAGMWLSGPENKWIEIWLRKNDQGEDVGCLIDNGKDWANVPAPDSATPIVPDKPKEGVTPDTPDANGSIQF